MKKLRTRLADALQWLAGKIRPAPAPPPTTSGGGPTDPEKPKST